MNRLLRMVVTMCVAACAAPNLAFASTTGQMTPLALHLAVSATGLGVAIVLFSLGSSAVNVGATILADLSEGGRMGSRLGVFRVTGDSALLLAPLAGGAIYEAYGRAWASLPLIAFVVVVIVLGLLVIPETSPRHTATAP